MTAVLSASVIFMVLYRYDNKFTYNSPQPIGGVWDLSREEFSKNSLYFPIYDWEFYPNALLTPLDFSDGRPDRYMEYITIGERTTMTKDSPFAKGTYRLNLVLPKTLRSYMIYLPEIFNSYRLYINGELLLDMGNIDTGEAEIQNRTVVFSAEGSAQIIIAANCTSHIYSGMIYVPTFGTPFAVNTARGILLLLVTAVTVIAFICFLLSIWLGLRTKQHYVNLFALLCAAVTGYTSYSIIHTYIPVSGMLTYTLEIVSYYAMFLLVILLHNRFCGLPILWKRTSFAVSVGICVLVLIFSAFSKFMTSDLRMAFSTVFTIYKWGVAANLIVSEIFSTYHKKRFSYPLLYGSTFFVVSLVFDRIYPLYEPIYSGWFVEISGAVFIVILGYIIWSNIMDAYSFSITFAEQKKQMERQLYMQKEHYDILGSKIAETRRIRHDMRQHFRVMNGFLNKGKIRELSDYINGIESTDYDLTPVILCQNVLIDALLQYYGNISLKHGIDFDARFSALKSIPISDSDLSVMLGNLLENAFEACRAQMDTDINPFISVHGSCNERNLKFRIINTMGKNPRQNGEEFYSSKHEGFGIGLRSVRSVVEKYDGFIDIIFENKKFSVSVIIPFVF